MEPLIAFLDANVLYPAGLRDLFMRVALQELFRVRWSEHVHKEWMQAVQQDFPLITREQLERTRQLMEEHMPDSLVRGYESLIEDMTLPDPDDRHILAAAITGQAQCIITFNLRDFPDSALHPYGIVAQHPDTFVSQLLATNSQAVCAAAQQHRANLRNPSKTVAEYLATLERNGLPMTAARLRDYAALI
jgi:predicted nucleic acid-binding protein